jgi:hypothetical protein
LIFFIDERLTKFPDQGIFGKLTAIPAAELHPAINPF